MRLTVRRCYSVTLPGDDGGYDQLDSGGDLDSLTFRDAVRELRGYDRAAPTAPVACAEIGPVQNRDYFEHGYERFETLHLTDYSPRAVRYWTKALRAAGLTR